MSKRKLVVTMSEMKAYKQAWVRRIDRSWEEEKYEREGVKDITTGGCPWYILFTITSTRQLSILSIEDRWGEERWLDR